MTDQLKELLEKIASIQNMLEGLSEAEDAAEGRRSGPRVVDPRIREDLFQQRRALKEELTDAQDTLSELERRDAVLPESQEFTPPGTRGPKFAVLIGHSTTDPGAVGDVPPFPHDLNTEFKWNSELVRRIDEFARQSDIDCRIFHRHRESIKGAYRRIKAWGASAVVELHFNSAANRSARRSETLYGGSQSRAWAQAMQDMMVDVFSRRTSERNKLIIPGVTRRSTRGRTSVTQMHPSALLEPFFATNEADVALAEARKQAYAEGIVRVFAKTFNIPIGTSPAPQPLPVPTPQVQIPDVPLFKELIALTGTDLPSVPGLSDEVVQSLRSVIVAQWAEESGWGRSNLAQKYFNFAGMKAIWQVDGVMNGAPASKVWYHAHDGPEWYLRFRQPFELNEMDPPDPSRPLSPVDIESLKAFIRGYFLFLERSPYDGWKTQAQRSPEDFIRFLARKWTGAGYANRVLALEPKIRAYLEGLETPAPTPEPSPGPTPGPQLPTGINLAAIPGDASAFRNLVVLVQNNLRDELRPHIAVVVAQLALESNWGRSTLARQYQNYAGIEWPSALEEISIRRPHPSNPDKGDYCKFFSPDDFVTGYNERFSKDSRLAGFVDNVGDSSEFARFLANNWRPNDPQYFDNVMKRAAHLAAPGSGSEPTPGPSPVPSQGFVIHVRRLREERRGSRRRTVGEYETFFNGQKLNGLEGHVVETRGMGDNSVAENGRRVQEGSYNLYTHQSPMRGGKYKYRTRDYSSSETAFVQPRPAVKLLPTGARGGILFHPGEEFKSSVGCLNFTSPLNVASDNMDWRDSRRRTIAVIDAMKARIQGFPRAFHRRIPGATIIIEGEPQLGTRRSPRGLPMNEVADELQLSREALNEEVVAVAERRSVTGAAEDLYYLVSEALTTGASTGQVFSEVFENASQAGLPLNSVRSADNETLWTPWVEAWELVSAIPDSDTRDPALNALRQVASRLLGGGVDLNDDQAVLTPLSAAAAMNGVSAIEQLLKLGANINAFSALSGLNPLLAAAFYGSAIAAEFLVSQGADPTVRTRAPVPGTRGESGGVTGDGEDEPSIEEHLELPDEGLSPLETAKQGRDRHLGSALIPEGYDEIISLFWQRKGNDGTDVRP